MSNLNCKRNQLVNDKNNKACNLVNKRRKCDYQQIRDNGCSNTIIVGSDYFMITCRNDQKFDVKIFQRGQFVQWHVF